eukprot:scaffold295401_cov37-Tisochrysis_lutea.AAC.1
MRRGQRADEELGAIRGLVELDGRSAIEAPARKPASRPRVSARAAAAAASMERERERAPAPRPSA